VSAKGSDVIVEAGDEHDPSVKLPTDKAGHGESIAVEEAERDAGLPVEAPGDITKSDSTANINHIGKDHSPIPGTSTSNTTSTNPTPSILQLKMNEMIRN
jgi:hypothetical protein